MMYQQIERIKQEYKEIVNQMDSIKQQHSIDINSIKNSY